jgi:thiosulfate/3-mercaptopyruvate sulfurtransferase
MSEASLVLTPKELKALLPGEAIPIDVTWFMPNVSRDASSEYSQNRLPGARFWSLDRIASQHPLGLAHMMPSDDMFANACGAL